MRTTSLDLVCFAVLLCLAASDASAVEPAKPHPAKPNIVFILADDMGYGDPHCFNPQSKCRTPNIDRLAAEGTRFTDAHAAGPVCVPSRYGLLTGRYPFRAGAMNPDKRAMIEPGRVTIASLLHDQGYDTAMIGKWHLGFDGGDHFDYAKPLRGGPIDHGFNTFFGQHASLDIPPYFFIDQDRCLQAPAGHIDEHHSPDWSPIQGAFWRAGPIAPDFKMQDVLQTYTRKGVEVIDRNAKAAGKTGEKGEEKGEEKAGDKSGKPFFLYLALTGPHTPWVPMEQFRAPSQGNLYTDFVAQVDDSVGQVLAALDRGGLAKDTLVFFASDNGPVWYPEDVTKYGHTAAGSLRGMKGDAWEAGHREPFVVRWPGKVAAGKTDASLVSFADLLATFASITGATLPEHGGEDSFSFLPQLLGDAGAKPARREMVIQCAGELCLRQDNWELIPFLGSGGFTKPTKVKPKEGEPTGQLYDLSQDLGETHNVYAEHPEVVKRMTARVAEIRTRAGTSRAGTSR